MWSPLDHAFEALVEGAYRVHVLLQDGEQQLDIRGLTHRELVERLSGLLWRLRRVPYFEAAIMNARQVEVDEREHCLSPQMQISPSACS